MGEEGAHDIFWPRNGSLGETLALRYVGWQEGTRWGEETLVFQAVSGKCWSKHLKWERPLPVYWRTWFAHFQFNTHFGGRVMSHLPQVRYTDGVCSYLEGRPVLLSPFFVSLCCLLQPSSLCKYCLPWLPLSKIKILPTPLVFVAHEFLLSSVVKCPWPQSSYNSHCCLEIRVP